MKKEIKQYQMNLQQFAEGDEGEGDIMQTTPDNSDNQKQTLDDVLRDPNHQAEFDKKVSKALETAKTKWEQEYSTKLETEKKEAERLAKLSAEEKQKELLKKQEEALTTKEKELLLKEMKLEAIKILDNKELPIDLVDFLVSESADTTKDNIDIFEKAFREAVQNGIDERLRGKEIPKEGIKPNAIENPWASGSINLTKQMEIAKKDPELAKKLAQEAGKKLEI